VTFPADSASLSKEITDMYDRMWVNYRVEFMRAQALHDFVVSSSCVPCVPRAHLMIGRFYWADGYYDKAIEYFRSAATAAQAVQDVSTLSSSLLQIGVTFYYQAYYDSALGYYNKAYELKASAADSSGMIQVLHDISLMYHRQGNFRKALEYLFREEALKVRFPEGGHLVHAMDMGNLIIDSIYYVGLITTERRDLAGHRLGKDTKGQYRAYFNLGQAHRKLKDHLIAARYFVRSCEMEKEMKFVPAWEMAAGDYKEAGRKDSSLYYYYRAKSLRPFNTRIRHADVLKQLGDCHSHFGRLDSAKFYYDSTLSMSRNMNNRISIAGIKGQLVGVLTRMQRYDEAERHLHDGLALAKRVSLLHERTLYINGRKLYEAMGNHRQAIQYADKYAVLQDSISKSDIAYNLTRVQAEFKTAQKEEDLRSMEQQNLLKEAQIRTRNLQIALAGAFLLVAGSVGTLYYSRYRHEKKAHGLLESKNAIIERQNENLQTQNKEKEALLHEIHHRVKNNLQIITSLINLKTRNSSDETMLALQQLNGRIQAMGLVHEKLYQSENIQVVRMDDYLTDLAKHVLYSFDTKNQRVNLDTSCDPVEIYAETALTCGLINNELITNSIKYAFPADELDRKITLSVKRSNGTVHMTIADNGRNTAAPVDQIKHSFGLRFVDQLVKSKLKGEWAINQDEGFRVEIAFKPMEV